MVNLPVSKPGFFGTIASILPEKPGFWQGGRPNGLNMREKQAVTGEYKPHYRRVSKKKKKPFLSKIEVFEQFS
jgi:hypothetical protein